MYMSVVTTAQYLANISIEQDFNSELCNAISSFFCVDIVVVAEKNLEGEITLHDCCKSSTPRRILRQRIISENVLDVLDTGLVKVEDVLGTPNITMFFIPIEVEKKTTAVLIIGHYKIDISAIKDILNEYLAVARLAGSIQTRIIYERESIKRKSNEKFRLLFDSSRDPILLLDENGDIIECNEATIQMLGVDSKRQVLMRRLTHLASQQQTDRQQPLVSEVQLLYKVVETGNVQIEWVVQRHDGSEFIVDVKLITIQLDGNKVQLVHWRDITERKRIEKQLQSLNTELETKVLERTRELQDINAVLTVQISERYAAEEALRQLNAMLEHKVRERTIALSSMNAILEKEVFYHHMANIELLDSHDALAGSEAQLKHYSNELAVTNTKLMLLNKELQQISLLDGLTGIANRRYFDVSLAQEWQRAQREQTPLALLMVDIDFFKDYNDTYGHVAGDNVLKLIGGLLKTIPRRTADFVARYGGEEFAIVLPDTNEQGAVMVGEDVLIGIANLDLEHRKSSISKNITVSIGVAVIVPKQDATAPSIIVAADQALYQAKREGRNCIKVAKHLLQK